VVFNNNIFYAKADEDIATVKLYDITGKLVYDKTIVKLGMYIVTKYI